jgi:hypothetical protein
MRHRFALCRPCAAKLREILARDGESAMAREIPRVLCPKCFDRSLLNRDDKVVLPVKN